MEYCEACGQAKKPGGLSSRVVAGGALWYLRDYTKSLGSNRISYDSTLGTLTANSSLPGLASPGQAPVLRSRGLILTLNLMSSNDLRNAAREARVANFHIETVRLGPWLSNLLLIAHKISRLHSSNSSLKTDNAKRHTDKPANYKSLRTTQHYLLTPEDTSCRSSRWAR